MAHEILPSPYPDIILMRFYRELEAEDIQQGKRIGIDNGKPIYIMVDVCDMAVMLPPNFLEHVRASIILDDNLGHIAVYTRSDQLSALVRVVGRLTGKAHKLSAHSSREGALNHLLKLIGATRDFESGSVAV